MHFSMIFMDFPLCLNDEVMLTLTRGCHSSVFHVGSLMTVELPIQTAGEWTIESKRME